VKIKDQLSILNVRPSKERGQNFLLDEGAISEIVRFGNPKKEDNLIEIGPGLGALTKELVRFGNLTVIEVEEKFCQNLKVVHPNITVINEDVRTVDFSELGDRLVVFGNLPYSLSTEIIFHILSFDKNIKRAVFLLQREFVERIAAEPGGRDYGALTLGCQLYAQIRLGLVFGGDLFHPPTNVQSQLIEFQMKPGDPGGMTDKERAMFPLVVRAAFFNRRKKIVNSMVLSRSFTENVIKEALGASNISSDARAETVSLPQYIELTRKIVASE